ncbi:MAG: hypothetical protein AB8F65_08800 [Woeseiaceae bacterium]
MAKFMMTYFGGNPPETPEAGKAHFAEFQAWLGELGDAVISPANPLKDTQTVKPDGTSQSGSETRMSGYTLLEASDIDAAVAMAASCPFLTIGGTLEVAECIQMG